MTEALLQKAELHLAAGDTLQARRECRRAMGDIRAREARILEARAERLLGRAEVALGETARAQSPSPCQRGDCATNRRRVRRSAVLTRTWRLAWRRTQYADSSSQGIGSSHQNPFKDGCGVGPSGGREAPGISERSARQPGQRRIRREGLHPRRPHRHCSQVHPSRIDDQRMMICCQ